MILEISRRLLIQFEVHSFVLDIMVLGTTDSFGNICDTRDINEGQFYHYKIPLTPPLLETSIGNVNNVNTDAYPDGAADSSQGYMMGKTGGMLFTSFPGSMILYFNACVVFVWS